MKLVTLYWILVSLFAFLALNRAEKCSKKSMVHYKSAAPSSGAYRGGIPPGFIDGRLCDRQCTGQRQNCFFNFNLETFYTMSKACYNCPRTLSDCFRPDCIVGGGVLRVVMVVNRTMPGPAIVVCQGDRVRVHLSNKLADGEGTTIHWHGQHMRRTPYMDGVPFVTQCPVHHNNEFDYDFLADDAGTFWWHSHVEFQRGDGTFGCLIVRQTYRDNNHADLYDFDLTAHVIMAMDWNDRLRMDAFEGYALAGAFLEPTGVLVNGLGYQFNNNITNTPLANFVVQRGRRYRFRFINVGFFDCPLEFSIDNHPITIIASDSEDVQPVLINSFVSSSGERFDFVLNANQAATTYWIRVKGYLSCERLGSYTVATLQYQGSSQTVPSSPVPTYANAAPEGGILLNPVSRRNATGYSMVYGIDDLRALVGIPYGLNTRNPFRFYLALDMNAIDNPAFHRPGFYGYYDVNETLRARTPQINGISYKPFDVPLMPARYWLEERGIRFCSEETLRSRNCAVEFCECVHILRVPLGAVVELVLMELFDQYDSPALHPIHLHGYSFRVLSWDEIGRNLTRQEVINMDRRGELRRNFDNPPFKDTVTVPKGGYTIIRWIADNVGYWFMHCHIDVHSAEGMALVVKVGEDEEMPDPPENFPVCGNWPHD